MAINGLDTGAIAKSFQNQVTNRLADWFEAELTVKAQNAARRPRIIKSHGHRYSYSRYQNTGQLARNIRQLKRNDKVIVDAGTRANYTGTGYHGMYFLVEKQGERDVKTTLKKGAKYTESLKL